MKSIIKVLLGLFKKKTAEVKEKVASEPKKSAGSASKGNIKPLEEAPVAPKKKKRYYKPKNKA